MSDATALRIAIDLMLVPSRVRALKKRDLPDDASLLLHIVAGDGEAMQKAVELTDKSRETVRAAAAFFIEQVLLDPECDSYRVLGANKNATNVELRRNMAFLLRWLHPDVGQDAERAVFVGRVTSAWDNLKTPERRAAYDATIIACGTERQERRADTRKNPTLAKIRQGRRGRPNGANLNNMRNSSRADRPRWPKQNKLLYRFFLFIMGRREY
ncbi:MAG: DnaJ domain-containing protein [Methylocystis silviterrae]|uniref:J domain-containing protein n=1 Tax=Methylocystis silviterrae TaxID=2743612 RepID=UPI003C771908